MQIKSFQKNNISCSKHSLHIDRGSLNAASLIMCYDQMKAERDIVAVKTNAKSSNLLCAYFCKYIVHAI